MATAADAEVILKLYDLRREATLRRARHFMVFEFAPKTFHELQTVQQGAGTEESAFFRQVLTYWEMAASLVLRGAVDPDLYFDSNGEGIVLYAKYSPFREEYEKATGRPFMKNTAKLIADYPAAQATYQFGLARFVKKPE